MSTKWKGKREKGGSHQRPHFPSYSHYKWRRYSNVDLKMMGHQNFHHLTYSLRIWSSSKTKERRYISYFFILQDEEEKETVSRLNHLRASPSPFCSPPFLFFSSLATNWDGNRNWHSHVIFSASNISGWKSTLLSLNIKWWTIHGEPYLHLFLFIIIIVSL